MGVNGAVNVADDAASRSFTRTQSRVISSCIAVPLFSTRFAQAYKGNMRDNPMNPNIQCERCGRWMRLHGSLDGPANSENMLNHQRIWPVYDATDTRIIGD